MGTSGAVSEAMFIFKASTKLSMSAGKRVLLQGGASAKNIYWSAGTAATFEKDCVLQGNLFSGTAGIHYAAGCVHYGRYDFLAYLCSSCLNRFILHCSIFFQHNDKSHIMIHQ